jgi:flavodoxin I
LRAGIGSGVYLPARVGQNKFKLKFEKEKRSKHMSKLAVVYWSGTGNTEAMAKKVAEGARAKGAEVSLFTSQEFTGEKMDDFDSVAFGCPSMGVEQLEETEFEPMFDTCKSYLRGKRIGLFGSYGWGDGEWMRIWEGDCRDEGAVLVCESVICCEAPDEEAEESCMDMGRALA